MTFHVETIGAILTKCNTNRCVTDALNNILSTREAIDIHEATREAIDDFYRDVTAKIDSKITALQAACPHFDRNGVCSVCGAK